jgi:hypothetical protein
MSVLTSHTLEADFVVIGGGMAGVCAALAAARNGARVILVQNRSLLGGNASSEVKMHIVGADCHGSRPGARESGLMEEFRLEDAARNPGRSYAQWDLLLYDKVVQEPRITLLLNTDCIGCNLTEGDPARRIAAVRAVRQSTEDEFILKAPFFADCSGDGRLGVEAGAHFTVGREGRSAYGESLAPETGDRRTLGSSILFTARLTDRPQPFVAPSWVRKFRKGDFIHRPIKSYEYGYWWLEWGGHLDTLKDNELIRHELIRISLGIWDYIKNSGDHPDSANWILDWTGVLPGKRESRRFLGPYVLRQSDVEGGVVFPDQVGYGGWWIDLHPPEGIDAVDEAPCVQVHFPHLYGVPLRALYSRNVENLFLAGRLISATHVAFASTRVMATCAVLGQAIGTAAALLRESAGVGIGTFFAADQLKRLQQQLLKDDAFLPGLKNEDPADLARAARVSASSETAGNSARHVIDGHTRELFPHLGLWADGGTHRWESVELPAWIELAWRSPQSIGEIHLTFDSGLQRELILSSSDSTTRKVVRGPQPETARDYEILLDGASLVFVRDNYLRKRIHRLATPVSASRLRLLVKSTQGLPHARLFECRVY